MTRKRSSSEANVLVLNDEDGVDAEETKVGGDALALAEASRAAQLSKETRKATAFDLDTALAHARRSLPDTGGRSGSWPRGSQPAIDEGEVAGDIPPSEPVRSDPPPRVARAQKFLGVKKFSGAPPPLAGAGAFGAWARAALDVVLLAALVAAAVFLLRP